MVGAKPTTERTTMTSEGGERARSRGRRARNGGRVAAGAVGGGGGLGAGARGGSASPVAGARAEIGRGGRGAGAESSEAGENREAEVGSARGSPAAGSERDGRAHLAAAAGRGEGGAGRHPGDRLESVVRVTVTGAVGEGAVAGAAPMAHSLRGEGGGKIGSGNETHSQLFEV